MQRLIVWFVLFSSAFISSFTSSETKPFLLHSSDIKANEFMNKAQEFNGFGCKGGDVSPHLSWTGAPKETAAYAVMAYDPDAPTGSGWWHWQIVNIPSDVNALVTGSGNAERDLAPKGSRQIINDYGISGFGGACPPKGHGIHRYQFTVYALSKKLDLPADPSGALVGYMVKAHAIAESTIEALYKRD